MQAVIDLGSTSSRLLVVDGKATIERRPVVTHMGAGLDQAGHISDAALRRVEATIEDFASVITARGAELRAVVATAAAREAANVEKLAAIVDSALGVPLRVLSGEEEATVTFGGVVSGLNSAEPVAVVDIGGRSTEVVVGSEADGVLGSLSLDTGASRVTEQFLDSDPPRAEELSAALSVVGVHLDDIVRELPSAATVLESGAVVGVGGTITTAAAIEIGLLEYDPHQIHGFVLTKEAAEDVFRTLATESEIDRIHNPGLSADRAGVIVGGMCMLVGVMRRFGIEEMMVSERDLLDGLLVAAR